MGEFIRSHFPVVAGMVSLVMTTILALLSKTYVKREEVDDLRIKLNHLESKLNSLPTVEQIHHVEIAVSELSGDVKEIKAAMKAIGNTTQLLLEKHMGE